MEPHQYEIKNHFGKVSATVTDRRLTEVNSGNIEDFRAEVEQWDDYYAFGAMMPGRRMNPDDYRFGFNSMESDDKIKGTKNSYDFGARMYDPRVGRWWSIDPKAGKYPGWSPYNFSQNSPIVFKDPDGKEIKYSARKTDDGTTVLNVTVEAAIVDQTSEGLNHSTIQAIASSAKTSAEEAFSGQFKTQKHGKVKVNFNLQVKTVKSFDKIEKDDHAIGIVDEVRDGEIGAVGMAPGHGGGDNVSIAEANGRNFSKIGHTAAHELGHNLGLKDMYKHEGGELTKIAPNNLMGAGDGTNLTETQLKNTFRVLLHRTEKDMVRLKYEDRNILQESGNTRKELEEFSNKNREE